MLLYFAPADTLTSAVRDPSEFSSWSAASFAPANNFASALRVSKDFSFGSTATFISADAFASALITHSYLFLGLLLPLLLAMPLLQP